MQHNAQKGFYLPFCTCNYHQ